MLYETLINSEPYEHVALHPGFICHKAQHNDFM